METNRQIIVEGMTCTNCALSVSKRLEKIGLEQIKVDFLSGEVNFSGELEFEEIAEELGKIGFVARREEAAPSGTLWSGIEFKLLFSAFFTLPLILHMFLPHEHLLNNAWVQLGLSLPVTGLGLFHFGKSGWASIKSGIANMDVLIFIGAFSAFSYSLWGTILYHGTHQVHSFLFYETAATIITLVLLGNWIEHRAVNQTTSALRGLMKLQKIKALRIVIENGQEILEDITSEQIRMGDVLLVNSGDRIPVDGIILSGEAHLDESMLTGESLPVFKSKEATVTGGTLLSSGNLRMQATKVGKETTLSKIIALVKEAQQQKPAIQQLGDRISAIFVPAVVGIAFVTFLIHLLLLDHPASQSLMNAVAVLVISCPCAMGLATPTALAVGIGRAAKSGILFKGGDTIERLAGVNTIVFDKTGTLTTGEFSIQAVYPEPGFSSEAILNAIAGIERHSSHPIAKSLVKSIGSANPLLFSGVQEIKGKGLIGSDPEGNRWALGKAEILNGNPSDKEGLHLYKNERLAGRIIIGDTLRKDAESLIRKLQNMGYRTVLLSGDHSVNCKKIAEELGITEWYAEQMPEEKLKKIREWSKNGHCAMVGDGINDAPALAAASVGISLGEASQIAMHSAQVILLNSELIRIAEVLGLSVKTLRTIKQNFFWAFFYNVIAIPIAGAGFLSPMIAALSMAFSDVMVVGNSILLKFRRIV